MMFANPLRWAAMANPALAAIPDAQRRAMPPSYPDPNDPDGFYGTIAPAPSPPQSQSRALVPIQQGVRQPAADPYGSAYQAHHQMHGREPGGMFAAQRKRSLPEKILRGVGDFATAWAAGQGNPVAINTLKRRADERDGRRAQEAEFGEHKRIVDILIRQGMSVDQAELAALNTGKLGEEYSSRFRSRDLAPGHTAYTPNFDGSGSGWTAPKTFQEGADVMQVGPGRTYAPAGQMSGMPAPGLGGGGLPATRLEGLRTTAEQYADSLGLEQGSPDWGNAVRDFVLKGDGPTAYRQDDALQDQRLYQSDQNNRRSTGVSRDNSLRSTTTSRENSIRSAETTRGSNSYKNGGGRTGGRAATAVGPDGRRIVVRNGKWVDAQTGQPVQ